jgi:signal peptidase I
LSKNRKLIKDILEVIVPAIILFLVVRTFVFEVRVVPSGSMSPTIIENDRFIAGKVTLKFRAPRRGEILVFKPPASAQFSTDYVKRVIGLPGETWEMRDGAVYINGSPLEEPYLPQNVKIYGNFAPVKIPEDHYFMMGDNRNSSEDSRYWGFMPAKNIRGRAVFRLWPLDRFGSIY